MKKTYLQIRMSDKEKEGLRALAEANDMTMSEYVLSLIRFELKRSEPAVVNSVVTEEPTETEKAQ